MAIEPTEFDLIALGTGLPESILAGAAAKAGKSVLHLDGAEQYGSHWAGLSLDAFLKWVEATHDRASAPRSDPAPAVPVPEPPGLLHAVREPPPLYRGFELLCGDMSLMSQARDFVVDLAPKLALAAGNLVDGLVQSGAHNYMEFKLLQGSSLWQHGKLCAVPASRADIFKDRRLTLGDKRKLMRLLKEVVDPSSDAAERNAPAFDDRPLVQLLEEQGLSQELQEFVMYGLVLATTDQGSGAPPASARISAAEGKAAMLKYIASAGRHGPGTGAFILPLYGSGEIPQAFCRVGAVGGATYVLRCPVDGIVMASGSDGGAVLAVRTGEGQLLRCRALVGNAETLCGLLPPERLSLGGWISRCVAITDGPIQEGESMSLVVIPPRALDGHNAAAIHVLQLGPAAAVTPAGSNRYLVYFTTAASSPSATAAQDLRPAVDALLRVPPDLEPAPATGSPAAAGTKGRAEGEGEQGEQGGSPARPDFRPRVLVMGFYQQATAVELDPEAHIPPNVALCPMPDGGLEYSQCMQQAEQLYGQLFPGEPAMFSAPAGGAAADPLADDSDEDAIEALGAALQAAGIPTQPASGTDAPSEGST